MKEHQFVITEGLNGWNIEDLYTQESAEMFCEEELEIPSQYIETLQFQNNLIKLSLLKDRSYRNDDWYVNLQRVASA